MKSIKFFLFFLITPALLFPQNDVKYRFAPVVITANRSPVEFQQLNRKVTVIDSVKLSQLPAQSIQDVLAYSLGVDLQSRGPFGIQAEAGIRGGGFEETLILIDGVKINDPQTAHHNFDFPVTLQDVSRIEILHGQGAGLYGADALSGVIHIITKNNVQNSAHVYSGEFGLMSAGIELGKSIKGSTHRISLNAGKSDGYTEYTDFEKINVHYRSTLNWNDNSSSFQVGYNNKSFGANSFYSSAFPNEREHTKTLLASLGSQLYWGSVIISPIVSWKRHDDDFILDNSRPDWYRNLHTTHVSAIQIPLQYKNKWGLFSVGAQIENEKIFSSNLGDHNRTFGGYYASWTSSEKFPVQISTSAFLHYYARWGWKSWPGIDFSYKLNKQLKIYSSVGASFRIPSFTELYYTSPANMGNPGLVFSSAKSFESGLIGYSKAFHFTTLFFARKNENVIDWARKSVSAPWQVLNITELNTMGFENNLDYYPLTGPLETMNLGYSYIFSNRNTFDHEFKYALGYSRYQLQLGAALGLPFGIVTTGQFQLKKRNNQKAYSLLDLVINYRVNDSKIYLKISNIFDSHYTQIAGVPMPGRWIILGYQLDRF